MTDLEAVRLQRYALWRDLGAAYERNDEVAIRNLLSALNRAQEQVASLSPAPKRYFRRWLHRMRRLHRRLRRQALAQGKQPLRYREFSRKFLD